MPNSLPMSVVRVTCLLPVAWLVGCSAPPPPEPVSASEASNGDGVLAERTTAPEPVTAPTVAVDVPTPPAPDSAEPRPPATPLRTADRPALVPQLAKARKVTAVIETSFGPLTCDLFHKKAPKTVESFVGVATGERVWTDPRNGKPSHDPVYDGTSFHRIIKGFMIQGGDPKGDGTGEPGFTIEDEIWPGSKHDRAGQLCMANRGKDTNGLQFFITDSAQTRLDGNYTIFGQCAPVDLVHTIARVPTGRNDRPDTRVGIEHVTITVE